jgi:hypothetical protein
LHFLPVGGFQTSYPVAPTEIVGVTALARPAKNAEDISQSEVFPTNAVGDFIFLAA